MSPSLRKAGTYIGIAAVAGMGLYVATRPEVGLVVEILASVPAVSALMSALWYEKSRVTVDKALT